VNSVKPLGRAAFRLKYNDSIQLMQNEIESFFIFDANVAQSVTFVSSAPVVIRCDVISAISVSGSPAIIFKTNLTTILSVVTIPTNGCGRGSKSITGIRSINYTFHSASLSDLCLFPLPTASFESIQIDPPDVSTFVIVFFIVILNGRQ
jgi:hypothetical protein